MTGFLSTLLWPSLPAVWGLLLLIVIILVLSQYRGPLKTVLSGTTCGVLWIASVGYWQLHWQLQDANFSAPVKLSGEISSIVTGDQQGRFNLRVDAINEQSTGPLKPTVRISWQQSTYILQQGNHIEVVAKLKAPRGLANQGGFNYQQWLFSQGIVATGYVKENDSNKVADTQISIRQSLINRLRQMPLTHANWIEGLMLGYRGSFSQQDWQMLQRTGLSHLLAISGMHLGMVGIFVYLILRCCLGLICLCVPSLLQRNAHVYLFAATCILTLGYAQLTGFAVPALRAWLMAAVWGILLLCRQSISLERFGLYSVFMIFLLWPLSVFTLSFWLSIAAVIVLMISFWRWPKPKMQRGWQLYLLLLIRIQVLLVFCMAPLTGAFFQHISIVAIAVNLVAVPVVTLLLLPLHLLGLVTLLVDSSLATVLFGFLDNVYQAIIPLLVHLSSQDYAALTIQYVPGEVWLFLGVGALLLLIPPFPLRKLLVLFCGLPLLSLFWPTSQQGDAPWFVHVFDVGQGLAVAIERRGHWWVYDVGPAFDTGFNTFEAAVMPAMGKRNIDKIDWLVVSHFDNDHSGSLAYAFNAVNIERFASSEDICQKDWQTHWQGLSIQALWPDRRYQLNSDNNRSCVLRIGDGNSTLLLTGDIEKDVERLLVSTVPASLKADIVVVPHHGSKTSSTRSFVTATHASYAVVSRSFNNRWGFPHPSVKQRYLDAGVDWLDTAENGQITFEISMGNISVKRYRQDRYPFWYANGDWISD